MSENGTIGVCGEFHSMHLAVGKGGRACQHITVEVREQNAAKSTIVNSPNAWQQELTV